MITHDRSSPTATPLGWRSGERPTSDQNGVGPTVTRAPLQADLLAAYQRATRLNARVRQLEKWLSEALGD